MVGVAEPTVAGPGDEQPPLGFDAHELVTDLWAALAQSVEGQFFSTTDWQRARLEMWHADKLVRSGQPTANQWAAVQRELDELLTVRRLNAVRDRVAEACCRCG